MPKQWLVAALLPLLAASACRAPPPVPPLAPFPAAATRSNALRPATDAPELPPDLRATPDRAPAASSGPDVPQELPPAVRVTPYRPAPASPPLPPPVVPPIFPSPTPPPGGFAPGLPSGPVTNYGTGGMQQMPGAPPNPPYPPGGLMH